MTVAEAFPFDLDVCAHCEQIYRRPDSRQMALMAIKPVLKVRYVVEMPGHRTKHFVSRVSAYRHYAWLKLRETYPCDKSCTDDYHLEGCNFRLHHPTRDGENPYSSRRDTVQYLQVRFVRWLMWRDAKLRGGRRVTSPKRRPSKSNNEETTT